MVFTVIIVFGLFALHGVEIWTFALFYRAVGAVPTLESALYFSSITYGTIGYADDLVTHQWRLVAAFEGIAGIILLGWSTAFFVRLLGRIGPRYAPSPGSWSAPSALACCSTIPSRLPSSSSR